MLATGAPLNFYISVEPSNGKPTPGKYTLRLSLKVNDVERPICEPVSLRLSVDPRTLDFAVFLFPGKKNVVPAGSLYSMRVWLRVNGVDHRIFGEDELWVGKDLDFETVADMATARLRSVTQDEQVYEGIVGRARVRFTVRWHHIGDRLYKYTLEYDASGVGVTLIDDLRLIVDGDPRRLTFLIYTVPMRSVPVGASHRLRVWLKSLLPAVPSAADSVANLLQHEVVYQRLWKSDAFKLGARLDFEALGPRLIMGASACVPQTVVMETQRAPQSPLGYQQDPKARLV
ncbi:hypothetical protein B0H17DRAFT_1161173 [Mycena rosella]|uniref:Uncharacterized protein n=1 Tax=Mycena rosella TaxID=1033263 RepID=A0AAD7D6C8_MYCRO|nr:hypothetical protein B0H17DRAFT_1161173 [Mycena rosella]